MSDFPLPPPALADSLLLHHVSAALALIADHPEPTRADLRHLAKLVAGAAVSVGRMEAALDELVGDAADTEARITHRLRHLGLVA
jgi:hypothetical protein